MTNTPLRCQKCGQPYRGIENIGAWECPDMFVYSESLGRSVAVPADHDGPYSSASVIEIPSYVREWLRGVRSEAILDNVPTREHGSSVQVYEMVKLSRVDQAAYAETQRKYAVRSREYAVRRGVVDLWAGR